jgi:hypothetical protein
MDPIAPTHHEELDRIQSLLANPATSRLLEGADIAPSDSDSPYWIELYQLIPIGEHAHPWVLSASNGGDWSVTLFGSQRGAEAEYEYLLAYLEAEYADSIEE